MTYLWSTVSRVAAVVAVLGTLLIGTGQRAWASPGIQVNPTSRAGGTNVDSFSWTTRGLSPAWIERMPSTISARACSSSWESCFMRAEIGR